MKAPNTTPYRPPGLSFQTYLYRLVCSFACSSSLITEGAKTSKVLLRPDILYTFWTDVTCTLSEEFHRATEASCFLKQAFEGEYPKLLRLYNELWRRLQQYSTSLHGALTSSGGLDMSLDITNAEIESQDLFTHGKQDYK
ncbi:hypothetical protein XENORESO_011991 [Xenotaenia resolanae]|uniref:Conserved oligomeric Golgi complex subunit 5 helical domain-containing protein n=1 Tax=Xenotaenia resolanae TaxID=208358 RepID=A0ABV0WJW4_9TELE